MDDANEKMVTVTLKIPERVGKVLWVLGEESFAAINGFEDMQPIRQFAYIADVATICMKMMKMKEHCTDGYSYCNG